MHMAVDAAGGHDCTLTIDNLRSIRGYQVQSQSTYHSILDAYFTELRPVDESVLQDEIEFLHLAVEWK